jgi:hypothetical protein
MEKAFAQRREQIVGDCLGGHLKTGQRWSLQNRPTKARQDKSIYTSAATV